LHAKMIYLLTVLVLTGHDVEQGCTTYLKRWATRKCRTKAEGHNGGLGAVPPVGSRGNAPGQGVRGAKPP